MPPAKQALQDINREMEYLNKTLEKRRKDIQDLNKEISQARIHLREFITRYFSDLIRQVSGASLETFNDFVIREIGDKGINMDTRVQNEFERQTQGISNEIAKIGTTFNADMSSFEKHAGTLGKIGIKLLEQSKFMVAENKRLQEQGLEKIYTQKDYEDFRKRHEKEIEALKKEIQEQDKTIKKNKTYRRIAENARSRKAQQKRKSTTPTPSPTPQETYTYSKRM
ncbi:hypothetical protein HMPREF1398_01531 [Helicobacter pylori GAM117Ai]|nr:hypothetical protein HMPREF1398_01531 [Helicobacter pylori GAM117Ai]